MSERYHQMDLFHDYSFSDEINPCTFGRPFTFTFTCDDTSDSNNTYQTGPRFILPWDKDISGIDEDGNPYIETRDMCEEPPIEDLQPRKIIFRPPATVVIWADGMKTVVKCKEGTEFNPYYGFTCALAKKIYQSNEKIKRMIKKAEYQNEERK